jgi:hypothetical protein
MPQHLATDPLGIATEQGTGIKNPTGLFFALTKKPKAQPGAS